MRLILTALLLSAATVSNADTSAATAGANALCEGWAGNWHISADTTRQPDGTWQPDGAGTDWRVETLGPGRCRFYFGTPGVRAFDIDASGADYVYTPFADGQAGTPENVHYLRREIRDARHWTVEILEPIQLPARPKFTRLTMIMAGDNFFISSSSGAGATGPFRLESYTTHVRRP